MVPSGGKAFGERFEDTIVRIQPTRIISFSIGSGETASAIDQPGMTGPCGVSIATGQGLIWR